MFLAHLSERLNELCPSSVVVIINVSHFHLLYGPISTKLGSSTKHAWLKGIQVCSNEWPYPYPRGDNNEIAQIH